MTCFPRARESIPRHPGVGSIGQAGMERGSAGRHGRASRSPVPLLLLAEPEQNQTVAKESKQGHFLLRLLFGEQLRRAFSLGVLQVFPCQAHGAGSGGRERENTVIPSITQPRQGLSPGLELLLAPARPCWRRSTVRQKQRFGTSAAISLRVFSLVINEQKRR